MPYPPPIPLPVPAAISPVPPEIVNLELDSVGLMSPEEQQSNQQLYHSVRALYPLKSTTSNLHSRLCLCSSSLLHVSKRAVRAAHAGSSLLT